MQTCEHATPVLSILDRDGAVRAGTADAREPSIFHDLHLDQIVEAIVAGREEYNLKPFFYSALASVAAVEYRQGVMRDLQTHAIRSHVLAFADLMRQVRTQLARKR